MTFPGSRRCCRRCAATRSCLRRQQTPWSFFAPSAHRRRKEDQRSFVCAPLNRIRNSLLRALGAEPAEWDLLFAEAQKLDASSRTVFPLRVYLEELRSPYNVGAIFRTAEAFGVERIYLSPGSPSPDHPRAQRTARGTAQVVPWSYSPLSLLESEEGVFALELGGTPVGEFAFPPCGIVLVGSEELGLSPEALRIAEAGAGRVCLPMAGAKRSLNVAVAFGILMYAWFTRLAAPETHRPPGQE